MEALGIGDVDSVQESEQVENREKRYNSKIDLPHELRLGGMRGTLNIQLIIEDSRFICFKTWVMKLVWLSFGFSMVFNIRGSDRSLFIWSELAHLLQLLDG